MSLFKRILSKPTKDLILSLFPIFIGFLFLFNGKTESYFIGSLFIIGGVFYLLTNTIKSFIYFIFSIFIIIELNTFLFLGVNNNLFDIILPLSLATFFATLGINYLLIKDNTKHFFFSFLNSILIILINFILMKFLKENMKVISFISFILILSFTSIFIIIFKKGE